MTTEALTAEMKPPAPLATEACALFLDLDGTLAPIAARPEDVRPDPRRTSLIAELDRVMDGRLAVVSGRTLEDVDRILEGRLICVAAVHGLVRRRPDGMVVATVPHPALPDAARAFRRIAQADPGLLVEEKGHSVTLHYRQAPHQAGLVRLTGQRLAEETGLVLQTGDMVMELRTPGPDKGDAVRDFMAEPPFAGTRPVFVGDDATDEAGFAAAEALRGFGVLVGAARPTRALWRLANVEATLAWLEARP